jgi:hypothetical protein
LWKLAKLHLELKVVSHICPNAVMMLHLNASWGILEAIHGVALPSFPSLITLEHLNTTR